MLTRLKSHSTRLAIVQAAILATFFLVPAWLKLPSAPRPFTATYVLGFWLAIPMLVTICAWILLGLPRVQTLFNDRLHLMWVGSLCALSLWIFLSQSWAYTRATHPEVGSNTALQMALVTAFVIVTACAGPSPRRVIYVYTVSILTNALIGGWQVALQGSVGLSALGEFQLDPLRSGVSIIQAEGIRWLRPYGLLSHPNILAGSLASGLLMWGIALLANPKRLWPLQLAGIFSLWWILLLTFSRAAWLGFAVGLVAISPHILRHSYRQRATRAFLGLCLVVLVGGGLLFLWLYRPFVAARVGLDTQSVELRSIADRTVFTTIALVAIDEHPWLGIGGGNYPWYASAYLHYHTDYDLRGDYVHHIGFAITAEYGFVGLCLFTIFLFSGIECILRAIRNDPDPMARLGLLGAIVVFASIGLFEHYPWTLIHFQTLWLGLIAIAAQPPAGKGGTGTCGTDTQSPPNTVVS